jgi:transcriptional regulator with XRE-family HTH domain
MKMIDKIVTLAEAKGWDQGEFESLAGLPHGRISKWKADQGEPNARQALRMARLLDVPVEFLVDDSMEQPTVDETLLLAPDERYLLQLVRDLRLSREDAARGLAIAARMPAYGPNDAVQGKVGRPEPEPSKLRKKGG